MNAVRTGATARSLLLPGENVKDVIALEEGLRSALQPVGAVEEALVLRAMVAELRRRRIEAAERSVLARELADRDVRRARRAAEELELDAGFARASLDEDASTAEERALPAYARRLADERELMRVRDSVEADLGVVFSDAAVELEKLERHRAAAERAFDRAIKQLGELQERRRSSAPPSGVVVDVTDSSAALLPR